MMNDILIFRLKIQLLASEVILAGLDGEEEQQRDSRDQGQGDSVQCLCGW